MFADETPVEEPSTLIPFLPVIGWALVGVLVLVAVWRSFSRYGLPDLEEIAGRVRGVLVMRGRSTPVEEDGAPAAPAAPEPDRAAAPPSATEEKPAAQGAAPPQPEPLSDDVDGEAPPWLPKALVAIASVPTLLALPWAAYAVSQHLPVPHVVALPLGVLFDVAMVGAVLVALLVPSVSRQASAIAWIAAGTAAVAIATYTGFSGALVFAATPLISKALWGLLITVRRQQAQRRAAQAAAEEQRKAEESAARVERETREAEERAAREAKEAEEAAAQAARDAELSEELSFEQQRQIAEKKRLAKFKLDMAAAELELERAESEAEHQKALAEIRRLGEQQRAEDAEASSVYEQRLRLERQLRTVRGDAPAFLAVSAGEEEAEVVGEVTAKAGFGGAAPSAFGFQRPLDVKALTPAGASVKFQDLPEHHQALVKYVHTAKEPSMREAGRKLNRDQRTIGRWVDKLAELGYELPFDRKK